MSNIKTENFICLLMILTFYLVYKNITGNIMQYKYMSIFKKIGLFLSSFTPLFFLVILKELIEIFNGNLSFNLLNTSLIILLCILVVFGVISSHLIIKEVSDFSGTKIEIKTKQNLTDKHFLGYFSLFVLFAVTFEIEMYSMACVFLIVLFLIGVVYIKNDMYYINPFINLLGYSFYDVEYIYNNQTKKIRVFHKGRLDESKSYFLNDKYSSFAFLTKKNI